MSTLHPVPKDSEVRQILAMLYGDELELGPGEPVSADAGSKCMVAVYINDDNVPVTACVCDHQFAAFAGSALTRVPVGGAEDAAQTGEFSEMMLGNLHEIMNICSRLFMNSGSPHLRLDTVYATPDAMPHSVRAMVDTSQGRVHMDVSIPGYGNGSLSFLCT